MKTYTIEDGYIVKKSSDRFSLKARRSWNPGLETRQKMSEQPKKAQLPKVWWYNIAILSLFYTVL